MLGNKILNFLLIRFIMLFQSFQFKAIMKWKDIFYHASSDSILYMEYSVNNDLSKHNLIFISEYSPIKSFIYKSPPNPLLFREINIICKSSNSFTSESNFVPNSLKVSTFKLLSILSFIDPFKIFLTQFVKVLSFKLWAPNRILLILIKIYFDSF